MLPRTRFAPSPTGVLHIGSVRTALFSWLYARRYGGQFILRIEDTDRERSTQESVDAILEGMAWLGLDYDEGPFFQTRRMDRYREVIDQWLAQGKAYHCYCTREELEQMREAARLRGDKPRYDGRCRHRQGPRPDVAPVVRFATPVDGSVVVDDQVRGPVAFANAELDDLIIARADGGPTYNFTVVVDDADMRITHVIRGDDHLNNTPRQIHMLHAMGHPIPAYAHLPMIHGSDGTKLSKRHGAVDVREYREQGFLPEAMLNYLARLGWAHGDQEIFSIAEMTAAFDLNAVNAAAAAFDADKLLWVNHQHLMRADPARIAQMLAQALREQGVDPAAGPDPARIVAAFRERARTVREMAQKVRCYYEDALAYEPKAAQQHLRADSAADLAAVRDALAVLPAWEEAAIQTAVEGVAKALDLKLGKIAQPLRVALTGDAASPGIGLTLLLVGRDRTLVRIDAALRHIEQLSATAS